MESGRKFFIYPSLHDLLGKSAIDLDLLYSGTIIDYLYNLLF